MVSMRSGRAEGIPYSLSRWTDVSASPNKWSWMLDSFKSGGMLAFDPRTAVPSVWSLAPEETLGLIFWTKDPTNLVAEAPMLRRYRLKIHVTLTGWEEVEKGAPSLVDGTEALIRAVDTFGPDVVTWRFSPVPLVEDVVDRFEYIARRVAPHEVPRVFLSFLQENDLMPETRDAPTRIKLMQKFAAVADDLCIRVLLCNEDRTLVGTDSPNLGAGICAPPEDFALPGLARPPSEGCGCVLMADPFTINESCTMGCQYCLAPETPVLYSDLVWRPIGAVQVGDRLISFDEFPERVGAQRKLRETIVEGVRLSRQPTLRMITGASEVVTTANHGWIRHRRGNWQATSQLRKGSDLRQMGYTPDLPFTDDYRIGYLAGMSLGDGTFRYQPGQHSDKLGFPQPYWRVALKDEDALGRIAAYLASFGVEAHIRPFYPATETRAEMKKVEIRALGRLASVHDLVTYERDTQEYRRGFLAGFFDAEGTHGGSLRMFQKDRAVLTRVDRYAAALGFQFEQEFYETSCPSTRLVGPARERLRFLSTVRPAISRKKAGLIGMEADSSADHVEAIEAGPVQDVVDIQTSTHTFFAAGLATHNCYAADKTLSPKKRNTTRRSLPVV